MSGVERELLKVKEALRKSEEEQRGGAAGATEGEGAQGATEEAGTDGR